MFYFYDFILKSKCETKIALYFLFNKFSEYTKLHAANRRFQGGQIFVARRIHSLLQSFIFSSVKAKIILDAKWICNIHW